MLLLKSSPEGSDRSIVPPIRRQGSYLSAWRLHFHCALGFCTRILAYMLDSLVRVSRRVKQDHFVSITNLRTSPTHVAADKTSIALRSRKWIPPMKLETTAKGADWNLSQRNGIARCKQHKVFSRNSNWCWHLQKTHEEAHKQLERKWA